MTFDDAMVEPVRRIVRFVETGDRANLDGVFVDDPVIVESIAPFVFTGPGAVDRWADSFGPHLADHRELRAWTGPPLEVARDGDTVFLSLPVEWEFDIGVVHVVERGCMSAVLRAEGDRWRVAHSAWGVVGVDESPVSE